MPSIARCAVNNSNMSSDAKNINLLAILQNFLVPSYLILNALSIFQVKGILQGNSNFSMSSKAVLDSLLGEGGICICGNVDKRPHAFWE